MIMDNALKGRVALVTGASGGIGQAIVLGLAGEGAAPVTRNHCANRYLSAGSGSPTR